MWAKLNSDKDTIEEIIVNPKTMIVDGITHPKTLFSLWTDAERKAIGIVPVTTSGVSLDSKYYIEKNEAFAIAGDKNSVVRTIGEKAADKKLDDEDAKDEDGKQLYEDDGTTKKINYGLKTVAKEKATTQANGLLKDFDWLIQRKVTADTAIPSDVVTYMAAVRTAHASICTAIDNASDIDAFKVLHTTEYNEDGSVKTIAKVQDWPDDSGVKGNRR
jgi:hypothetical protein